MYSLIFLGKVEIRVTSMFFTMYHNYNSILHYSVKRLIYNVMPLFGCLIVPFCLAQGKGDLTVKKITLREEQRTSLLLMPQTWVK